MTYLKYKTKTIRMLQTARMMFILSTERNELEVAKFWGNECVKLSSILKRYKCVL